MCSFDIVVFPLFVCTFCVFCTRIWCIVLASAHVCIVYITSLHWCRFVALMSRCFVISFCFRGTLLGMFGARHTADVALLTTPACFLCHVAACTFFMFLCFHYICMCTLYTVYIFHWLCWCLVIQARCATAIDTVFTRARANWQQLRGIWPDPLSYWVKGKCWHHHVVM